MSGTWRDFRAVLISFQSPIKPDRRLQCFLATFGQFEPCQKVFDLGWLGSFLDVAIFFRNQLKRLGFRKRVSGDITIPLKVAFRWQPLPNFPAPILVTKQQLQMLAVQVGEILLEKRKHIRELFVVGLIPTRFEFGEQFAGHDAGLEKIWFGKSILNGRPVETEFKASILNHPYIGLNPSEPQSRQQKKSKSRTQGTNLRIRASAL